MEIEIIGDKWRWEIEYKGNRYGDTLPYKGESEEELKQWADKRWLECKNIIDNQTL
jgi:hypothetical protein